MWLYTLSVVSWVSSGRWCVYCPDGPWTVVIDGQTGGHASPNLTPVAHLSFADLEPFTIIYAKQGNPPVSSIASWICIFVVRVLNSYLTLKQLVGHFFFQTIILFPNNVHHEFNIVMSIWSSTQTMNVSLTQWMLMAWCLSIIITANLRMSCSCMEIFVPRPFRRKKGELWNCIRSSVHQNKKLCRCYNSATTGLIRLKSNSTVLACRCATSCSFARQAIGTFFTGWETLQLSAWYILIQISLMFVRMGSID